MACEAPLNESMLEAAFARLPLLWLRHFGRSSVNAAQEAAAYHGLKGWGRTRFLVRKGRLLFAPTAPTGCVLRRTPILAWALLETLSRYPALPDVAVTFNCRDKPTFWLPEGPQPQGSYEKATTAVPRDGKPALVFSYTTGHTFSDVPLPDATFWGLPYARIRPWHQWLASTASASTPCEALPRRTSTRTPTLTLTPTQASEVPWEAKLDRMLWVGTAGVGNGKLGF